jgi:hypothetical protein
MQSAPQSNGNMAGDMRAGASSSAPLFPLPWMRERAERLQRFCLAVDAGRARGLKLREALKGPARIFHNWRYKTAPDRKPRFRRRSLQNLFYKWRAGGKQPAVFSLRYLDRHPYLPAEVVRSMVLACANPAVVTIRQAARKADLRGFPHARALSAMPASARQTIFGVLADRLKAHQQEQAAVRETAAIIRRRRLAEKRRARTIWKLAASLEKQIETAENPGCLHAA